MKVIQIRKVILFSLVGFLILNGCVQTKKLDSPSIGFKLINKAKYYYGGIANSTIIDDSNEINFINEKIKNLTDNKSDSIQINVNYGYVEVDRIHQNNDLSEYFHIVFTQSNGDIVRLDGEHYYYNQELVDFIKKKLKMAKKPKNR